MTENNYRKISHSFTEAVRAVALKSMNDAAEDTCCNDDNIVDMSEWSGVSLDGTWQCLGFSSKNGAVAAISIEWEHFRCCMFSRYCQGCINMEMHETSDPDRYELWRGTHKCPTNHAGSGPAMEEGVKQIFSRSISNRKLRYTEYYGDGTVIVDRLENYYGIAIQSNVSDLPKMKKAIGAVLFHCASSKENE